MEFTTADNKRIILEPVVLDKERICVLCPSCGAPHVVTLGLLAIQFKMIGKPVLQNDYVANPRLATCRKCPGGIPVPLAFSEEIGAEIYLSGLKKAVDDGWNVGKLRTVTTTPVLAPTGNKKALH